MDSSMQNPEPSAGGGTTTMGEGQRLCGVFLSPRRTFADIVRRPTFRVPIIVAWIASLSVGFLYANRVLTESAVEEIARTSVERGLALEGIDRQPSDEEVEDRADAIRRLKRFWPVGTTVELVIVVVGISLLYLVVMRLFGERLDLRSTLSVTSWSWMAWTLLFAIPAWLRVGISPRDAIGPLDPYALSVVHLGHLVSADMPALVRTVATNLSLQNLWFLALLVVGYSSLSRNCPPARIAVLVFGMALVGFLIRGVVGF